MEKKAYWVGFNHVRGVDAVCLRGWLEHFGSLEMAWKATSDQLISAGINQLIIENFSRARSQIDLEMIWNRVQKIDISIITWLGEGYPRRLKEIDQPSPVLYARENFISSDDWAIAIVGTQRKTTYGRQVTEEITSTLVHHGITIVSGLARGIDFVAHTTAIKSGGRTIAVFECGVDQVYPPENRKLADEICENGLIIREYAPGTPLESNNFPPRNRIISDLSQAVVIVEADDTSGALITDTFAAEQGREVFIIPGGIFTSQSKGCNRLILDGAHPLLKPDDIPESLQVENIKKYRQARLLIPADRKIESQPLKSMAEDSLSIDEIIACTGLPIDQVSAALITM